MSDLTINPPPDYLLGPGDKLAVTVHGLQENAREEKPIDAQIMANGEIQLPLVGSIRVGKMNLQQAQRAITNAYADGYLTSPSINVALVDKSNVSVLVLGEVEAPGTYLLPKYENDIGHAIAAAGGLSDDAADSIEIHAHDKRAALATNYSTAASCPSDLTAPLDRPSGIDASPLQSIPTYYAPHGSFAATQRPNDHYDYYGPMHGDMTYGDMTYGDWGCVQTSLEGSNIRTIALRGHNQFLRPEDILLESGDVIVIPSRKHEVFYVVGRLSQTNTVRFTVGDRERELGVGFILPRDREIDVVTAVTMAGYIDPIESPTTVTVHRTLPNGYPLLVNVDLIAARYDPRETILVEPGDIIYLNPDKAWYFRQLFDRIVGDLILIPYDRAVGRNN